MTHAPLLADPLHFIGIGGSGMSALAELALARGYRVQGSDTKATPITERLAALGARIVRGHAAENLGAAQTVILSSAIGAANPEQLAAKQRALVVLHRSELLAHLMEKNQAITVAGTHGKTTTTAMIGSMLDDLGVKPTIACGGTMRRYASSAHAGSGEFFVAEADESDGSFVRYRPHIAVVTNVDQDHMEFFKNEAGIERTFAEHLARVSEDGAAIFGWDSRLGRQIASHFTGNRLTFGFALGSEVRALDYQCHAGETSFLAVVERDKVKVRLATIGRHNVLNALCALAVARTLELDVEKAALALADYRGVHRRMELIAARPNVRIFDDYAHNPGKIAACVDALREAFPKACLHVVYQPHRYSRLETMYDDMLKAVSSADHVHVVPVYSAGETTTRDFSPERLAADLNERATLAAHACASFEAACDSVLRRLGSPAIVLTVGAGDVWRVAKLLEERLE